MRTHEEKLDRLCADVALDSSCARSALEGFDYTDKCGHESIRNARSQLYMRLTSNPDESTNPFTAVVLRNKCSLGKRSVDIVICHLFKV